MEATTAGCAVVAHADGEVSPHEMTEMFLIMRTDPLMSMFPRNSIASEFDTHVWARQENARTTRDEALRQVSLLGRSRNWEAS